MAEAPEEGTFLPLPSEDWQPRYQTVHVIRRASRVTGNCHDIRIDKDVTFSHEVALSLPEMAAFFFMAARRMRSDSAGL